MHRLLPALVLFPFILHAAPLTKWEPVAKPWDRGLGSHRVVVTVAAPAPAVHAHIEWRRPDRDPAKKAVLVYDLTTGKEVPNVLAQNISGDAGDVTFQPVSGAGEYAVYFLPVKLEGGAFPVSRYLPPKDSADPAWVKETAGAPNAEVSRWEAISLHDAWTEMEIMATRQETAAKAKQAKDGMVIFVTEPDQGIRVPDRLPARWAAENLDNFILHVFSTRDVLIFQVAVWATDRPLKNVRVSAEGIDASEAKFTCLSTDGLDWNGQPSKRRIDIPAGQMQSFWCLLERPNNGNASWRFEPHFLCVVNAEGVPARSANVWLRPGYTAAKPPDSDSRTFARLRWLNSTTAVDDEPVKGYTPLEVKPVRGETPAEVKGYTIRCLGRELEIGENGLPAKIRSYFNRAVTKVIKAPVTDVLAAPLFFGVGTENGPLELKPSGFRFVRQSAGRVTWECTLSDAGTGVTVQLEGSMEFDGSVRYRLTLAATKKAFSSTSTGMGIFPFSCDYVTGLQQESGSRGKDFEWKWDTANKHQDSFWMGAVNGGLRVQLRDENYVRPSVNIHYKRRPLHNPSSWNAGGTGKITLTTEGHGNSMLMCTSGPFTLEPGKPLHFDFDLLITPFHTLRTKEQWDDRYYHTGGVPQDFTKYLDSAKSAGANVVNIHQGNSLNPYINYPFLTWEKLRDFSKAAHDRGMRAKYYYTVRELSNWCPELFAFRSMGDEILMSGKGGGHPWGEEHLGGNYWQAWFEPATQDVSFLTQPMSRFHNYYIEGLRWLCENAGCDGIYLDDIAYDRSIMLRARKVLDRYCPRGGLIDLHSWNEFHDGGAWAHCANIFMDSMPFVDRLWFGEGHHYSGPPAEHFLVEISGIPFGLMGEMLEGGGNPWLGLVHGCTGRLGWGGNPRAVWKLWDSFGVQDAEFIGWWAEGDNPVQPRESDVKATIWKKKDATLLALANFSREAVQATLKIDWNALGLDAAKAKLYAPAIPELKQREALLSPDKSVLLKPYAGAVFIIDEKEHPLNAAPALAGPGEVIVDEDFSHGLDKSWKSVLSSKAANGARLDTGYVLQVPANVHAYLERDLPDKTSAVGARIWQDGKDQGQQWGPGIALVWPDGKTLRVNVRQDGRLSVGANGSEDLSNSITARAPVELRIQWDKDSLHIIAGGPAMGDLEEEIATFPRDRFPGPPTFLRTGKMPNNATPRDFGEPGPTGFNRIERVRIYTRR